MIRCKLLYGMFDVCLFVATVVKSASMGQCGLCDQLSIISILRATKRAMKPTCLKIPKGGLGLGNPTPKITQLLQHF